jgi:hypothetical protein
MEDIGDAHESHDAVLKGRPIRKRGLRGFVLALLIVSVLLAAVGFIFFICRFLVPLPLCLSTLSRLALFVTGRMENLAFILLGLGLILSTITFGLARRLRAKMAWKIAARTWILCFILLAGMTYLVTDFSSRQRIAAWLCRPGYRLTFSCQSWDDSTGTVTRAVLNDLRLTLTKRLDSEPIGCVRVAAVPPDRITVALDRRIFPLERGVDGFVQYLEQRGLLEFRILPTADGSELSAEEIAAYMEALASKGPKSTPDDKYVWCKIGDPEDWKCPDTIVRQFSGKMYVLASNLSGECMLYSKEGDSWKLVRSYPTTDTIGRRAIGFLLDGSGAVKFADLTGSNLERPLCILFDNMAVSAPNINDKIYGNGIITGSFSSIDVLEMVRVLNFHPLPAKIQLVEQYADGAGDRDGG